jgi:hypothetical protein
LGEAIEHRLLVVIGRVELADPVWIDGDVAGRASAGAAAQAFDGETVLADYFHHAPALDRLDFMLLSRKVPDA